MHVYTRVQVHLPMHVGVGQRLCQDIFLNLFLTLFLFSPYCLEKLCLTEPGPPNCSPQGWVTNSHCHTRHCFVSIVVYLGQELII